MEYNIQTLSMVVLWFVLGIHSNDINENIKRACTVYCEGDILHFVQISGIFNDSKTFVDMPMRVDPEEVNIAFLDISDPYDLTALQNFVTQYFYEAGSDLNEWVPTDLNENPAFIDDIENEDYRLWAYSLNQLWLVLGREVNKSATLYPQRTSFLPRRFPMIVPGGRFRESYYWDSWWIVRGLLVCDMPTTAEYVIKNLLDDLKNFNFVPNGGRIYYLDRSQPPLLSEMVISLVEYYGWESTEAMILLDIALPLLEGEYNWWMDPSNAHVADITSKNGLNESISYTLNHYHSNSTAPRPESYLADIETAGVELDANDWNVSTPFQEALYRNIRSGAETGWDFSSRWLSPTVNPADGSPVYNLSTIDATHILPVDLNAFMYKMELNLARMVQAVRASDSATANAYIEAAANRAEAIEALLWNSSSSRWNDYNTTAGQQILGYGAGSGCVGGVNGCDGREVSVSSWVPLWAGLLPEEFDEDRVVDALKTSGLIQVAGILTTTVSSGQQWDSPNAWPPLVLLIIEGLFEIDTSSSNGLATDIANAWLNTCYLAFNSSGYMYEKYNAFQVGVGGGGGEYTPQLGFGWSNGVALVLLDMLNPGDDGSRSNGSDDDSLSVGAVVGIVIGVVLIVAFIAGFYYYRLSKKSSVDTSRLTSALGSED